MKYFVLCLILIMAGGLIFKVDASQDGNNRADIDFDKIDAIEAMTVANAWKWSRKDIKSSVKARKVDNRDVRAQRA